MFKLITCGITALWFVLAMPAMAQSGAGAYPSKPIKIIVPFPAGGVGTEFGVFCFNINISFSPYPLVVLLYLLFIKPQLIYLQSLDYHQSLWETKIVLEIL